MREEIYKAAAAEASEVGYRNVTRRAVLERLQAEGIAPDGAAGESWMRNYIRAGELRLQLEAAGFSPGRKAGSTSPAWAEQNRVDILNAAYDLANEQGFLVPASRIAERAGVTRPTVNLRWGSVDALRRAVLQRARAEGNRRLWDQAAAVGFDISEIGD